MNNFFFFCGAVLSLFCYFESCSICIYISVLLLFVFIFQCKLKE